MKPFIVDTYASDTGIGAVLSQPYQDGSEKVVCYASCLLSKQECNYCVTRKFLHHFHQYLLGHQLLIRTDHGALTWLQNFKSSEGQLARWLEKLQEYQLQSYIDQDVITIMQMPCHKSHVDSVEDSHRSELPQLQQQLWQVDILLKTYRNFQLNDDCAGGILVAGLTTNNQQPSQDSVNGQIEYHSTVGSTCCP